MLRPILTTKNIKSNYMRSTLMIRKGTKWVTASHQAEMCCSSHLSAHTHSVPFWACVLLSSVVTMTMAQDGDRQGGGELTLVSGADADRHRPSPPPCASMTSRADTAHVRDDRSGTSLTPPATYLVNVAKHGMNKTTTVPKHPTVNLTLRKQCVPCTSHDHTWQPAAFLPRTWPRSRVP